MLNTIAATAALLLMPAQDEQVKLEKIYKAGDTDTYSLAAKLHEEGGMEATFSGKLVIKILKDGKDGKAEAELSTPVFVMNMGGSDAGSNPPEALKTVLNKNGMPHELEVKDERWIFVLAALSGYLPSGDVKVGGDFEIDWKSATNGTTAKGKGTLQKVLTEGGVKIGVIKSSITVTPADDEPGSIEVTSKIEIATGRLVSTEGKVKVGQGMSFTFTMTKEKTEK